MNNINKTSGDMVEKIAAVAYGGELPENWQQLSTELMAWGRPYAPVWELEVEHRPMTCVWQVIVPCGEPPAIVRQVDDDWRLVCQAPAWANSMRAPKFGPVQDGLYLVMVRRSEFHIIRALGGRPVHTGVVTGVAPAWRDAVAEYASTCGQ